MIIQGVVIFIFIFVTIFHNKKNDHEERSFIRKILTYFDNIFSYEILLTIFFIFTIESTIFGLYNFTTKEIHTKVNFIFSLSVFFSIIYVMFILFLILHLMIISTEDISINSNYKYFFITRGLIKKSP